MSYGGYLLAAMLRGTFRGSVYLGFPETLWGLVQLCWGELCSGRPTTWRLLKYLSTAYFTRNPPLAYPTIWGM